jgi:hypothetical protein
VVRLGNDILNVPNNMELEHPIGIMEGADALAKEPRPLPNWPDKCCPLLDKAANFYEPIL